MVLSIGRRFLLLWWVDVLIVCASILSSYLFRFNGDIPPAQYPGVIVFSIVTTVTCALAMAYFRMYRRMWQYASIGEIVTLCTAVIIGWAVSYGATLVFLEPKVPLSVGIHTLESMLLLMGGVRFLWRLLRDLSNRSGEAKVNVLIVGAGDCGALVAKELKTNMPNKRLIGFIDDAADKQRVSVVGLPVLGGRDAIERVVKERNIHKIIIAMPSVARSEVSAIIECCLDTNVKVQIIPGMHDLIAGKVSVETMRNVEVEDLLGREPVMTDMDGIADYVSDKIVLITGAGGSIGSELSRQLATYRPQKLLLLGHGENSIYTIEMELRGSYPDLAIEPVIADIQDAARMNEVFRTYRPQVVFHAAAHKHVPLMERNPAEAIKNNVFGTKNVADCADRYGTERFVLISSDKAVNPTSIMGATKRVAEMYIQSLSAGSRTKFAAVRFGNVLGSRGSVIPRFKEQIMSGGPVTVTHPEMVRYFMTIPEAVQLVIQAGALARGGEIFILDMGEPVRILDLAEKLIQLSGYEPHTDIPIAFSGIREGEKLYEELLTSEEGISATQHDRIFIGKPSDINRTELDLAFKRMEKVVSENKRTIMEVLDHLVPFFKQVS